MAPSGGLKARAPAGSWWSWSSMTGTLWPPRR